MVGAVYRSPILSFRFVCCNGATPKRPRILIAVEAGNVLTIPTHITILKNPGVLTILQFSTMTDRIYQGGSWAQLGRIIFPKYLHFFLVCPSTVNNYEAYNPPGALRSR